MTETISISTSIPYTVLNFPKGFSAMTLTLPRRVFEEQADKFWKSIRFYREARSEKFLTWQVYLNTKVLLFLEDFIAKVVMRRREYVVTFLTIGKNLNFCFNLTLVETCWRKDFLIWPLDWLDFRLVKGCPPVLLF